MKDKVSKNSLLEAHILSLKEAMSEEPDSKLGFQSAQVSSRTGSGLTIRQSDLPAADIDMLYVKLCED